MVKHRGFTLLEMLVVMSLLGLIMVAISSALRTMSQTELRIDERLQRIDQMRVARMFLKATLGRVDVIRSSSANGRSAQDLLFEADQGSISWVGIMPARHGIGGRYFFHLTLEEVGAKKALVLRYSPWSMETVFPDWARSDSRVLANDVTGFLVETEGLPIDIQATSAEWPRDWQVGWPGKDALPQRIRLTWSDSRGPWPPLLVGIRPLTRNKAGSGGFVTGVRRL